MCTVDNRKNNDNVNLGISFSISLTQFKYIRVETARQASKTAKSVIPMSRGH